MNLRRSAVTLNTRGSLIQTKAPRPKVLAVIKIDPVIITTLNPQQFLIQLLNGTKISYASEKTAIMRQASISPRPSIGYSPLVHYPRYPLSLIMFGSSTMTLRTIMFPTVSPMSMAKKILLLSLKVRRSVGSSYAC